MVDATLTGLRLALSEMNEGVRALLGPECRVPELVGELLEDPEAATGTRRAALAALSHPRSARPARRRSRRGARTSPSYLALVK